ncbi:MAG TPA: hybrid sensor histidine kinase/response regulator [Gammaproteobacteria bacterium]|nr:hybrid sensor histidine kinase/response regulator [Gammaproteobacteria bacterium]
MSDELGDFSMLELFRLEVENQASSLNEGLLSLEQQGEPSAALEALMRASHSIKGAARMVDVEAGVTLAHAMEDCFTAAQNGQISLRAPQIDLLLKAVDTLLAIATEKADARVVAELSEQIRHIDSPDEAAGEPGTGSGTTLETAEKTGGETTAARKKTAGEALPPDNGTPDPQSIPSPATESGAQAAVDNGIRVSAQSLNRLMGLAGEVRVEARWLRPFAESLQQVRHRQDELVSLVDHLSAHLTDTGADEYVRNLLAELHTKANRCRTLFSERILELDEYERRMQTLSTRLHNTVISTRMRPFSDATRAWPRMVRDIARELGKQVRLNIEGRQTRVDRDILQCVEAPLNHLIRNAIDHGIESPDERAAAGKPEQALLTVSATYSAGMLSIQVRDDGRGIDLDRLREKIVERGLVSHSMAAELSENELLEFLFLPGFSTREEVSEISGRGVGLNVVQSTVQQMRGLVHASTRPGEGTCFHLQLPITLSVMRALLVEIGGEPYAIPLARIDRALELDPSRIESLENRQYFTLDNQHVGIVFAAQVLGCKTPTPEHESLPVVVLGERLARAGIVVDRFLGERSLVVHPLDSRLGKLQDIAAASVLENGTPCLIIDVDDMLRSIDILIAGGRLDRVHEQGAEAPQGKRILVVDDSITVREVERNMLAARGYQVDVAVDGMDGWNAVRMGNYDLVISDIDMPRMNGFEFVRLIKRDEHLHETPVMIVSYKDREEDRRQGLEAGADYYLTKGSFQDETLIEAVRDLIGEPGA